jgi:hypothetical protein
VKPTLVVPLLRKLVDSEYREPIPYRSLMPLRITPASQRPTQQVREA